MLSPRKTAQATHERWSGLRADRIAVGDGQR